MWGKCAFMLFTPIIYFFRKTAPTYISSYENSQWWCFFVCEMLNLEYLGSFKNTVCFLMFAYLQLFLLVSSSVLKQNLYEQRTNQDSDWLGVMKRQQGLPTPPNLQPSNKWLRCWFGGQIKPRTGKIMCLWSINTDTRCSGFTLKISGPVNGPLCAFQLSSTNHSRGLCGKKVVWILPGDSPQAMNWLCRQGSQQHWSDCRTLTWHGKTMGHLYIFFFFVTKNPKLWWSAFLFLLL